MRIAFLRRFIWAGDGVIIALSVFVAGYLFLSLRPEGEEGLRPEETYEIEKPAAPDESAYSLQDYSVIWKIEPEEIVASADEGLPEAAQVKEELKRLVKVRGMVIEPSFGNFAILEDLSKKRQKSFKEGEFLGKAKITRITRDSVIFEFQSQKIALSVEPDISRVLLASASGPIILYGGKPLILYGGKPPEEPPQTVQPIREFPPPPPEPPQAAPLPERPEITPPPEEPSQEPMPRPTYTLPTTENP